MAVRRQRNRNQRPRLPQVQPGTAKEAPRPARSREPSRPAIKRKTVLVIEDNATIGGLLVALMREAGYRALRAWDVREALRMARDRKPELVLLELSLPYPAGLPLLEELKSNAETKDAPIVIVTGNLLDLTPEQRGLPTQVISKPVDIDRLENSIRKAIGDPEVEIPQKDYSSSVDQNLHNW